MSAFGYACLICLNGRLVNLRRTVEGNVESGPYTVPEYRWKWGQAEVVITLCLGYWRTFVYIKGAYSVDGMPCYLTGPWTHPNLWNSTSVEKSWVLTRVEEAKQKEKEGNKTTS
jgi:hypothetical protein